MCNRPIGILVPDCTVSAKRFCSIFYRHEANEHRYLPWERLHKFKINYDRFIDQTSEHVDIFARVFFHSFAFQDNILC